MKRKALTLTLMFCLLATVAATVAFADGAGGAAAAPMVVAPGKVEAKADPRVVGVLRTTDKIQVQRYVPWAYELKYANPFEVAFFLNDTVRVEGGLWGTFANPTPGAKGGMIVFALPEYQLDKVRESVQMLDRPEITSSSGTAWAYLQLHHRSSLDPGPPLSLLLYAGNDIVIVNDVETNAFYLQGAPSGVNTIIDKAKTYDIPTAMVTVAAKIYEVDSRNEGTLGLDFQSWKNGPGQKLFAGYYSNYKVNPPNMDAVHVRQDGQIFNGDYPSEFFDFLAVKGRAQVLVKSEVSVLSSVPAEFRSMDDVLYYPVTAKAAGQRVVGPAQDAAGNRVTSLTPRKVVSTLTGDDSTGISNSARIEREDERVREVNNERGRDPFSSVFNPTVRPQAGVSLWVKPIVAENHIVMNIQTTFNDVTGFDDKGFPMINTRVVDTKSAAVSGQEVLLSKTTRSNTLQTTRKVPLLGSIPVLGYLFGGEISGTRVTSVIESVTPTIVEKGGLGPQQRTAIAQVQGASRMTIPPDEAFFGQYGIDY